MSAILSTLESRGMCILHSLTLEDAETIASNLGEIVNQTDVTVRHRKERGPLVTSDKALDIHTDHHDVKYVLWHCLRNSSHGGYSLFSDADKFIHALTPEDIEALSNVHLYEHDVFNSGNSTSPMLSIGEDGKLRIYFSFWHVSPDDKNNRAVKLFCQLAKQNTWRQKLLKNDILIVDNHRMLHGRTAIAGDKRRHLKRFWIRDTFSRC